MGMEMGMRVVVRMLINQIVPFMHRSEQELPSTLPNADVLDGVRLPIAR